jgi:hypothetical protein
MLSQIDQTLATIAVLQTERAYCDSLVRDPTVANYLRQHLVDKVTTINDQIRNLFKQLPLP